MPLEKPDLLLIIQRPLESGFERLPPTAAHSALRHGGVRLHAAFYKEDSLLPTWYRVKPTVDGSNPRSSGRNLTLSSFPSFPQDRLFVSVEKGTGILQSDRLSRLINPIATQFSKLNGMT